MEERYIATADLGTSKIAVGIARVVDRDIQVIYYKETPSDGIRYSSVFNPKKASGPLMEALKDAENELGIKLSQLVIGLPRYNVRQESRQSRIERTDPQSCITEEEVLALKDMALDASPLSEDGKEEIFGAVVQSFSADDLINACEDDIIGIPSDSLEGNFKVFVGSRRAVGNIDILMKGIGIQSVFRYFLPDVTAKAVLSPQEMDNGVALIDLGAGVTSVTIYHHSILRFYSSIPFGAANVTLDIKHECGFQESLAENIKLAYGACMPEKLLTMGEKIIQINDDENGTSEQLPVKYLSEIITAREREIINAMLFEIQRSGYADRLMSGVVVTGGGANLTNLTNLIKDMSGYNVRMGFPRCKRLSCEGIDGICETGAAATVGMIVSAAGNKYINCTLEKKAEDTYEAKQDGTLFGEVNNEKEKRKKNRLLKKKEEKKSVELEKAPAPAPTPAKEVEPEEKKAQGKARDIFDSTLGWLFDDMK